MGSCSWWTTCEAFGDHAVVVVAVISRVVLEGAPQKNTPIPSQSWSAASECGPIRTHDALPIPSACSKRLVT